MRFFLDENVLSVARALDAVRGDVCFPGHSALPEVPPGTYDEDWLPVVGRAGKDLVLITRDRKIRRKPAELAAFRANGVRAFFITGKRELGAWDKLGLLVRHWEQIEATIDRNGPGPWAVGLTISGRPKDIPLSLIE